MPPAVSLRPCWGLTPGRQRLIERRDEDRLYAVDVLTGQATGKGAFPAKYQVTDLALPINQK